MNTSLFDSDHFFDELLRNPQRLPPFALAHVHIDGLFRHLHYNLVERVRQHMEYSFPRQIMLPYRFPDEDLFHFEYRKLEFFHAHFLTVHGDIKEEVLKRELMNPNCGFLLDELDRLNSILTIIGFIIDPSTQPRRSECTHDSNNGHQMHNREQEHVPAVVQSATTINQRARNETELLNSSDDDSDAASLELPTEKIQLELREERSESRFLASFRRPDTSTKVDQTSSDVSEEKEEIESTDEEDFETYSEEIRRMASPLAEDESSSSVSSFQSLSSATNRVSPIWDTNEACTSKVVEPSSAAYSRLNLETSDLLSDERSQRVEEQVVKIIMEMELGIFSMIDEMATAMNGMEADE